MLNTTQHNAQLQYIKKAQKFFSQEMKNVRKSTNVHEFPSRLGINQHNDKYVTFVYQITELQDGKIYHRLSMEVTDI